MRSGLSDNIGERLNLLSMVLGTVRPDQLSADYEIPANGPILHFLDPGAANRTITLPALKRGAIYGIVHVGAANSLDVVDQDLNAITSITNVQGAFFVCSGLEWKFLTNTSTDTLELTELSSPDGSITVTIVGGSTLTIEVDETNVDHDALFNFVADEHVPHTSVSITGDTANGVSGGGDISASRTLGLDFSGMTTIAPAVGDLLAFYDISGTAMGKMTISSLNAVLVTTLLSDYDPNKWVDHTSVSIQAGEGLAGGGDISATRTIDIDLTGLPTIAPTSTDEMMFYDISGATLNKRTFANFLTDFNILVSSDIGVTVEAYDAGLASIAGLTTAADKMIYTTALDTYAVTALTSFARTLLDDTDAATMRATLGLVIGTDVQAYDAGLASIAGLTTAADKMIYTTASDTYAVTALTTLARSLLDDSDVATMQSTLGIREVMTAATTFYIATTGSDSTGDGSSGSPWATIQKAVNHVCDNIDTAGYAITIDVANGTYTAGAVLRRVVGGGAVTITGDTTTPSNVVFSVTGGHIFEGDDTGVWKFEGLKLTTTTSGNCLYPRGGGSWWELNNLMEFGACAGTHMGPSRNATIVINTNYTVNGGANYHFNLSQAASVYMVGTYTVTVSGTPAFTTFCYNQICAFIIHTATTFSGSATGKRYVCNTNCVTYTNGGGASFYPGDTAGTDDGYGVYS